MTGASQSRWAQVLPVLVAYTIVDARCHAATPTSIFAPVSTPAQSIFSLSIFVFATVATIFVVVFSLLAYAVVKFRAKPGDDRSEPAQVYGSTRWNWRGRSFRFSLWWSCSWRGARNRRVQNAVPPSRRLMSPSSDTNSGGNTDIRASAW